MRGSTWGLILLPALLGLSAGSANGQTEVEYASFYAVSEYDEARDPAADLKVTVERAQQEGKRILLEVGGVWCGWCKLLDAYIHDHDKVSEILAGNFLIMKVNWSRENQNEAFLSQYPDIRGYPHLFVLEKDGTFLHSQGTGELEEGRSYNEEVVLAFLTEWAPPKASTGRSADPPTL